MARRLFSFLTTILRSTHWIRSHYGQISRLCRQNFHNNLDHIVVEKCIFLSLSCNLSGSCLNEAEHGAVSARQPDVGGVGQNANTGSHHHRRPHRHKQHHQCHYHHHHHHQHPHKHQHHDHDHQYRCHDDHLQLQCCGTESIDDWKSVGWIGNCRCKSYLIWYFFLFDWMDW